MRLDKVALDVFFSPSLYMGPLWPQHNNRLDSDINCQTFTILGCLRKKLVGVGFSQSVSYTKPIPTPRNIICCVGTKMAQMPLLTYLWVGLASGWGVRRFHNNIHMFSNPTYFWCSCKHIIYGHSGIQQKKRSTTYVYTAPKTNQA